MLWACLRFPQLALDVVKTFKPYTEGELNELLAKTKPEAGKHELFKTHSRFDSTARHAEWLG